MSLARRRQGKAIRRYGLTTEMTSESGYFSSHGMDASSLDSIRTATYRTDLLIKHYKIKDIPSSSWNDRIVEWFGLEGTLKII